MLFVMEGIEYKNILEIDYLAIPKGKITCIYGESGAGKSTLLRLLNNLISSEKGKVLYNGTNITEIDAVLLRRKIVMLSQTPVVFPGNIRENLLAGIQFAEKPLLSDDELLEKLKIVNLQKKLTDDAEKLSGGEQQRMALARVLLLEPEVFLLDEPSASLDEETEMTVIDKVADYVKANNKTMIMVTHARKIVEKFAEFLIKLDNGQLVNTGEDYNG